MTVRTWFRQQRRAMWANDRLPAEAIDHLAYLIEFEHKRVLTPAVGKFIGTIATQRAEKALIDVITQTYWLNDYARPGTYGALTRSEYIHRRRDILS